MDFIISVLRSTTLKVLLYIIIGIGVNTAPPHYPEFGAGSGPSVILHSLTQYVISVTLWPLSFWHPEFNVGKWTGM